jgi:hypothetical protein
MHAKLSMQYLGVIADDIKIAANLGIVLEVAIPNYQIKNSPAQFRSGLWIARNPVRHTPSNATALS